VIFQPKRARPLSAVAVTTAVIGFWALALCHAQTPVASPAADRETRWQQDLTVLANEFASHHADFTKVYPQPGFQNELTTLRAHISDLTDNEIVLRLMRLVASAHIDHTFINLPLFRLGFRQLPLSLRWYSDGLAVVSATPDLVAAVGAHVLRIGTMTPEQLLAAISPYISHENAVGLRQSSPGYLETLTILQQAGAAGADEHVVFTLAKPGGEPFTLTVTPGAPRIKQVAMVDALHLPAVLNRQHPGAYYWYEYLADSGALYIQYNLCENDPRLSFRDFAGGLFAFADSHRVERVVIDLRFNPGGDSSVINPLTGGLKARAGLGSKLYVLIGPDTASSAQDAAIQLRRDLHATLVGEPTREAPNGYGEVRSLTLPNSGLRMQYATKYFRMIRGDDSSELAPHVLVPSTLDDALAGRDPVLESALRLSGG
jgi:hypothetical protein